MTGSRIYDGDLVYVKSCSDVENGDIAVVLLNHSEVTIKKILKKEHTVILMATNPVVCHPTSAFARLYRDFQHCFTSLRRRLPQA